MRTLDQWLSAYAESHQNPTNKKVHNICVPVIFFVIVALIWKISPLLFFIVGAAASWFYYRLSPQVGMAGACAILACGLVQAAVGFGYLFLMVLFVAAWIGQFYGHQVEGKKPSFFDDLQFLLIGPLWVAAPWLRKQGLISTTL
ncbi:MAG: DUF962 domain-containing protein [Granulosicoccaceae bacterium]